MSEDIPINDTVYTEVLGASITDRDRIALSILVVGGYERGHGRVTIERTVLHVTIPATIVANTGGVEAELLPGWEE